jgi:hypothetical protein
MSLIAGLIEGGAPLESYQGQTSRIVDALRQQFPGLMQTVNNQLTPTAQAELDAARAVTPGYNDLALSELNRNAPAAARANAAVARGDIANLNANGAAAGAALRTGDEAANKEFYDNLGNLSGRMGAILNEATPDLSAGERAEIERGNARVGYDQPINDAAGTAARAANFGSARGDRLTRITNVVNSVANAMPSLRTGLNPTDVALGRSGATSGANAAVTTAVRPSNTANQFGNSLLNSFSNTNSGEQANFAHTWESVGDQLEQDSRIASNIASSVGSAGA